MGTPKGTLYKQGSRATVQLYLFHLFFQAILCMFLGALACVPPCPPILSCMSIHQDAFLWTAKTLGCPEMWPDVHVTPGHLSLNDSEAVFSVPWTFSSAVLEPWYL